MYKLCKTERSAARQQAIAQALLDELRTRPYGEITVTALCARLAMPRKTFYRYFDSLQDALDALLDRTLLESTPETACGPVTEAAGVAILENYFQYWLDHRALLDLLRRDGLSGLLVERGVHLALTEYSPLRLGVPVSSSLSRERILLFCHSGLTALMLQWHHDGCRETPHRMAQDAFLLLTRPLFEFG